MNKKMLIILTFITTLFSANTVFAGQVVNNASQASGHSVQAISHAAVAGAALVSGSVAMPLMISGKIGEVSGAAGNGLWEAADTPIGTPLPISDETFLTGSSPDQAMKE